MELKYGLNKCTNAEYHGDDKFMSSSSLKLLLTDIEKFHKEKILKERQPERGPVAAFDEGSLTHTLILEPHMVEKEYAFFDGMRKQGAAWEAFKEEHAGKGLTLMSMPQLKRCEYYVESYKKNKAATELIKGGESEHTICHKYADLDLKVRCDYINVDKGYIVDIKTSGYPVDKESFAMTVGQYKYELSAAMYSKIAQIEYGKPFEFYFVCIAKKEPDCQVFRLGEATRHRGELGMAEAIRIYKECMETGNWKRKEKSYEHSDDYEILDI